MENVSSHEMVLVNTHASGAEEWLCPQCGRRFMLKCPPANDMIILEPGDHYARHWGSNGGLRIGSSQLTHVKEDEISEERFRPWLEWLEDIDFDFGDAKAA